MANEEKRFKVIYDQTSIMKLPTMEIWLDTETGVNYLFRNASYGGGLTPLLDAEGKPVITPKEER